MNLQKKAAEFEKYVLDHFIDNNGVIYSRLNKTTKKPWKKQDWQDSYEFLKVPNRAPWDIINYENSGMTTGALLAAMSYKYMVTQEENTLKTASLLLKGLNYIFEAGKTLEEGFFPKMYGGKYSSETSTDQCLYAMKGMMAFREIADEKETALINHMICKMVDFWVSRAYHYDYFGIKDMLWPLGRFPALLLMAYTCSKDKKYLAEFTKLNQENDVYKFPADSQLLQRKNTPDNFSEYEKINGRNYLLTVVHECATMDIMELDECLERNDDYRNYWLKSMKQCWQEGKLSLANDGYCYFRILYNPKTHEVNIPHPGYTLPEAPLGWDFLRWAGAIKMPRSTMLARVGINVNKWLPEENSMQEVIKILNSVSLDKLSDYIPNDTDQILPKHKFLSSMLCGDSAANWLWAYWQGRQEGFISKTQ